MAGYSHPGFQKMDELSLRKAPFFFMTDFLLENVLVFLPEELEAKGLSFDFQNHAPAGAITPDAKKVSLKSFPESRESYARGFHHVKEHLSLGNSYLANYTCKTEISVNRSLAEIYAQSSAKYKVLYQDHFVLFSPETFIKINGHRVFTHPMKGTIDAAVKNAAEILKKNPKELAEHYTVVDLLRNDLSIIADDVKVTNFQRLDYLATAQKNLIAMSSDISGTMKPSYRGRVGNILQRLLPAGSILGAPKNKTLEIIRTAEKYDRGFYTGVCGYFDGENLDSCVMIRFIEKKGDKMYFRSGGGITHLSNLDDEYEEMKNKIYVPIY